MPKDRYFVDQVLKKNENISIETKEAAHMNFIMRKKKNDIIEIINGKGFLAKAKILDFSKSGVFVIIEDLYFEEEKKQKIILVQSLIKQDRLELVLEKCSELGVNEIWLLTSKNSLKVNFSKNKLERLQNILIAATKQCGRLYLPRIKFLKSLEDLKNIEGQIFIGEINKNCPKLIDSLKKNNENIFFLIGPESGFDNEEIFYFENNLKPSFVKLNSNTLRSETAAISAITIISHVLQI
jgi:16S rRNA (uracil1498-N3)-methyltransferase